jgi:hypothetical protein
VAEEQKASEHPSWLEILRQQAIIGVILGIRKGIATVNPLGVQAVNNDEVSAQQLLSQGNYERAFEVATGFAEYFDIRRQGKENCSSNTEIAAVMMGHAAGFNQAVETLKGENRSGEKISGFERFRTGLDALLRIANTVMTVAGGVGAVASGVRAIGPGSKLKVVSPVYMIAERDIVVVETSVGRQAFYRSSGINSGKPGKWFPVDEIFPSEGWFNKAAYTQGPGLEKGASLHRLGTKEFARISKKLGKMSIPKGHAVPAGTAELKEMTMNRILDFFGARKTTATIVRPVPED